MGILPVSHNAKSIKAAVVNPKVLGYGRPRCERDGAINCDIVENEVPQERRYDENSCEQKNDFDSMRLGSHLSFQ